MRFNIGIQEFTQELFGAADALHPPAARFAEGDRPTILLRRWNAVYFSDPKGSFGKESFGRVKVSRLSRTCHLRANHAAEYSIHESAQGALCNLVTTSH